MRRQTATLLPLVLAALVFQSSAQQVGSNTSNAPANGAAQFSTTANLVVETVSVKDKSGKPIEGLTTQDFTITEDGMPQTIKFFEFQKLHVPVGQAVADLPPVSANIEALAKLPRVQIEAETPGNVKYRNRRLLALYFDMSSMPIPDQLRAIVAAEKFIRTQMTKHDVMCLMMYQGSGVQTLQNFTDDRDRLLSIVVRYGDDLVVGFQNRADAERFLVEFRERLVRFGLELHPDKTRLIEFGRFTVRDQKRRGEGKPETFRFLGFTHFLWTPHEQRGRQRLAHYSEEADGCEAQCH